MGLSSGIRERLRDRHRHRFEPEMFPRCPALSVISESSLNRARLTAAHVFFGALSPRATHANELDQPAAMAAGQSIREECGGRGRRTDGPRGLGMHPTADPECGRVPNRSVAAVAAIVIMAVAYLDFQ